MTLIDLDALLEDMRMGMAPHGCYGTKVVEWLKSRQVDVELMPYLSITYSKDSVPILRPPRRERYP